MEIWDDDGVGCLGVVFIDLLVWLFVECWVICIFFITRNIKA